MLLCEHNVKENVAGEREKLSSLAQLVNTVVNIASCFRAGLSVPPDKN
uniref:Uncharacterized protein n=1 Tax=Anguilla anguilla TaxID=7936 RepID=A0A0E9SV59_ANGAN